MNENNHCIHTNESEDNGFSNWDDNVRKAASKFIHMIARNIWHSSMNKDVKPISFSTPFAMFNGEYLGLITCENHQSTLLKNCICF